MLNNKTIAVVVPAYNEESQIGMVIESMPEFVDRIIVINDCSKDNTAKVVAGYFTSEFNKSVRLQKKDKTLVRDRYNYADVVSSQMTEREEQYYPEIEVVNPDPECGRIILINHIRNSGKGAGIITGYKWCRDNDIDCTASMDGDGQMDPSELESLCRPVVDENIDYVKGNRLIHRSSRIVIPKIRFFGNSILSILTKVASGYWHVSDTQTGYTAISLKALNSIKIFDIYKYYGYPNDMLVKLNLAYCSLREVEIKPVYNVGEQSKMKISKVVRKVSWLLFKSFFKRIWMRYLFLDFHPLFLLYNLAFIMLIVSVPYLYRILKSIVLVQDIGTLPVLAFFFLFITGFQFLLFAMWMDMQDNERLNK